MNLYQTLGSIVRAQRKQQGLSQEALAELAELDPTYIGRIERGEANPTLLILHRLARALGVTTAQLLAV